MKEKIKQIKKDHILEIATEHFLKFGYEETKMSSVAKEATVSIGTIYGFFENKDGVFKASLCREISLHTKIIKNKLLTIKEPKDKLIKIVQHKFKSIEENRGTINEMLNATPWFFSKLIVSDPFDEILSLQESIFQELSKKISLKHDNFYLTSINFKHYSDGYIMYAMKKKEKVSSDPSVVVDNFLHGICQ